MEQPFNTENLTVNYKDVEEWRFMVETYSCYEWDEIKIIRLINMIKDGLHLEYSHPRLGQVKHQNLTDFITSDQGGLNANPKMLFYAVVGSIGTFEGSQELLNLFKENGFWYPVNLKELYIDD